MKCKWVREIKDSDSTEEVAAKLLEWFLDTNWHETWSTEDSIYMSKFVNKAIAKLRQGSLES